MELMLNIEKHNLAKAKFNKSTPELLLPRLDDSVIILSFRALTSSFSNSGRRSPGSGVEKPFSRIRASACAALTLTPAAPAKIL